MFIKLTKEEVISHPFWDGFYPLVVKKATGRNYDDVESIDCRKVNISPDIQDKWYEMANEMGAQDFELTMHLAISGPKACLKDDVLTVEVEDGAITFKEGDQ